MRSPSPLSSWIPALIATWRSGRKGEPDGLTTEEADRVAAALKTLSQGLTGERSLAGNRYLEDQDLLGAYLLYFWPVSFAQTLSVIRRGGLVAGTRALDLGSGPAPGALALAQAGWRSVSAADRSPQALNLARSLARKRGVDLSTTVWDGNRDPVPAGPWDLVVLGHVVNEWGLGDADPLRRRRDLLQAVAAQLSPQGRILVLEPASHGPNRDAITLRDALVASGWTVTSPCVFAGACPARAANAACHDEVRWEVPHLVAQIARRAKIDKRTLPVTWFVFDPQGRDTTSAMLARVVSEPMVNKAGRRRVVVCTTEGRFSLSAPLSLVNRTWSGVHRGTLLRVDNPQLREGGWGVGPETKLDEL